MEQNCPWETHGCIADQKFTASYRTQLLIVMLKKIIFWALLKPHGVHVNPHVSFILHLNIILYAKKFLSCGFRAETFQFWHSCVCYTHFPRCMVVVPPLSGEQHKSWTSSLGGLIPNGAANFTCQFECDLQPCSMMTYLHWNNNAYALLDCGLLIQ